MEGFTPQPTWNENVPKRRAVNVHTYVGFCYALLAALLALALAGEYFSRGQYSFGLGVAFVVIAGLSIAHFLTRNALEANKRWAKAVSIALVIPLLFGFPIGTIFGVYLLIAVARI